MRAPVHFSDLKQMALSPAHYRYAVTSQRKPTRAMLVGTMTHALVLGTELPPVFDGARRGKEWDEFQAQYPYGTDMLTAPEADDAKRIAEAVLADPLARQVLEGAQYEVLRLWRYCDRECSSRLDILHPQWIGELKVSNSAEPERFQRLAVRMFYPAQLAFYNQAVGREPTSPAFIVAVEDKPPYPVTVFKLTSELLDLSARQCRIWMEQLLCCEQAGHWPAYAQSVVPMSVPGWMQGGDEEGDDELIIDGESVAL